MSIKKNVLNLQVGCKTSARTHGSLECEKAKGMNIVIIGLFRIISCIVRILVNVKCSSYSLHQENDTLYDLYLAVFGPFPSTLMACHRLMSDLIFWFMGFKTSQVSSTLKDILLKKINKTNQFLKYNVKSVEMQFHSYGGQQIC